MSSENVNEPIFNVAQLAHVELLTPGPKGMLWYFKDLFRMRSPVPDSVWSYRTPAGQEPSVLAEAATAYPQACDPAGRELTLNRDYDDKKHPTCTIS
jgi:hypothetical protein